MKALRRSIRATTNTFCLYASRISRAEYWKREDVYVYYFIIAVQMLWCDGNNKIRSPTQERKEASLFYFLNSLSRISFACEANFKLSDTCHGHTSKMKLTSGTKHVEMYAKGWDGAPVLLLIFTHRLAAVANTVTEITNDTLVCDGGGPG